MNKKITIWDRMAKSFHLTSLKSRAHREKYFRIADLILGERPSRVLDLGCGSGILEKCIYDKGYRGSVLAIDASKNMLKIANSLVKNNNCLFALMDLENDFSLDEKFDVIVSINLFFFLSNKKNFLKKVSKYLSNNDSIFIMVTPKPSDHLSNWGFVKEHFRDTTKKEKIFIFLNEFFNIPKYASMTLRQHRLERLSRKGLFYYDNEEDINRMAKEVKLDIIKKEEVHAGQNWLFIMRRAS